MLTTLIFGMLLALPIGGGEGAGPCGPDNWCRGSCSGENVTASATPVAGSQVSAEIHICSQATGCSAVQAPHPDSSDNRMSLCKDGCKVTIAPEQGQDWGDINSCDDLRVICGEC